MRCRAARKRLSAYADGAMALYEMVGLKEHLSACGACRADLAQIRRLNRLLADRPAEDVGIDWPAFEARLAQRLQRQRLVLYAVPWYRQGWVVRGGLAAAAAVLILVTSAVALNRWLGPAVVAPLPTPDPYGPVASTETTIRYESVSGLMVQAQVVLPQVPAPAVAEAASPPPGAPPTRLASLAGPEVGWDSQNTTFVTIRYDDPDVGAIEHHYAFRAPAAAGHARPIFP